MPTESAVPKGQQRERPRAMRAEVNARLKRQTYRESTRKADNRLLSLRATPRSAFFCRSASFLLLRGGSIVP